MRYRHNFKPLLAWVLPLVPGLGFAQADVPTEPVQEPPAFQITLEEIRSFTEVMFRIQRDYVEPTDDAALFDDAIRGLLIKLDPYSGYLSPQQLRALKDATHGSYVGVGIEFTGDAGPGATVLSVLDDSAAKRAGIRRGDRLLKIGNTPVTTLDLEQIRLLLHGPAGSHVRVELQREPGPQTLSLDLLRTRITNAGVKVRRLASHAIYLRIATFQTDTVDSIQKALKKTGNQAVTGLVVDLRDNPGGVLEAAVGTADLFLSAGVIVSTRGRGPGSSMSITADSDVLWPTVPMAVLINHASASGAEIVAGALRDHHRAVLVGERSFGKGSVQSVITLPNGGGLKLTTAHYFTPNGSVIQGMGLTPDIPVKAPGRPTDTTADTALQAALAQLRKPD